MSNGVALQACSPMQSGLPDERNIVASWPDGVDVPVVSVLCHTFNQADFLHAALSGILKQKTDFPFEVILRDDASEDGSRDIVLDYARRYPRIIRPVIEEENQFRLGVKPISATFSLASGEFLAFCEGDDYWLHDDKLQIQVDFMKARPDCGLVHGNFLHLFDIDGVWKTRVALRSRRQLRHRCGSIYAAMLQANRIQTCTVLCRRRLVSEYRRSGLGVDGYAVGDWPLSLYISHESQVGYINRPIAAYRRVPGSITNSGHAAAVERAFDAVRMTDDFCDFFRDEAGVRWAGLLSQYRGLLWLTYRAGDIGRFEQAWEWLARYAPRALDGVWARGMNATIRHAFARRQFLGLVDWCISIKHRCEFS